MSTIAERAKKIYAPPEKTLDAILCYVPGLHEDFLPTITANLQKRAPFASIVYAPDKHGDINKNYRRNFRRSKADYCMNVDAHMRFNHNFPKAWKCVTEDDLPYIVLPMTNVPVSKGENRLLVNRVIGMPPLNLNVIVKTKIIRKWKPRYKYHPMRQMYRFLKEETGMVYQYPKVCGTHDRGVDLFGLLKAVYYTGVKDQGLPAAVLGAEKVRAVARAEEADPEKMVKDLMNISYHLGYKIGKEEK